MDIHERGLFNIVEASEAREAREAREERCSFNVQEGQYGVVSY